MTRSVRPLEIAVYQDVFCAWCYVAEARLEPVRRELGEWVRWTWRPFALRVDDSPLTETERAARLRQLRAAQREPEGARLSDELWRADAAPRSTVAPLAALEAARMLGREPFQALMGALRGAALEQGIDVSRTDVLLEMASALRFNVPRFAAALQSAQTRKLVLQEHRLAQSRGVSGAPTLVLGERWMISGLRDAGEYRALLFDCLRKQSVRRTGSIDPLLH